VAALLNSLREKSQAGHEPSVNEMLALFRRLLDAACDGSGPFGGIFLIVDELGKLLEHAAGGAFTASFAVFPVNRKTTTRPHAHMSADG
jgi:hypothetical protein